MTTKEILDLVEEGIGKRFWIATQEGHGVYELRGIHPVSGYLTFEVTNRWGKVELLYVEISTLDEIQLFEEKSASKPSPIPIPIPPLKKEEDQPPW